MKKLLIIVFLAIPMLAQAQDDGYTMYMTLNIKPDNANLKKLSDNLKSHNEKFHNKGASSAIVWSVASGPGVGHLIWMMGPLTLADLDKSLGSDHDQNWNSTIMPYVKSLGTLEYWRRNDKLSNIEGDPRTKNLVRYFKVKKGEGYRVNGFFGKIRDVVKALDGENPWDVYVNEFRQGDMGRHYAVVTGFNNWAELDEDSGFKDKFIELNGEGAWQPFLNTSNDIFEDSYDEIIVLIPELSRNKSN